ncbi:MAG: Hsp20/alpha crystallin family protein [Ignavibacteriae bacterium]|nr:Hsp20/alpha crystallin family protein [Ignavibacteriota bacterium]
MTETKELTKVEKIDSWDYALENEAWIAPLVDIYETDNDYFLVASMPGVAREDIKMKLEDGNLIIMGRVKSVERENMNYLMREIDSSNYFRKFKLSESVNDDKIDASMENGKLKIHLPKVEKAKPKTITIN